MKLIGRAVARAFTVACCLFAGLAPAEAATLTFETLATSPSGGVAASNPFTESGFLLSTAIPSGSGGFFAFEDGWQSDRGSSNGTTTLAISNNALGVGAGFTLQSVSGAAFHLLAIDLAELLQPTDFAFAGVATTVTFTGTLAGGGTVTSSFTLDLISDGSGGLADFQTVTFSSAWQNLASVSILGTNAPSNFGTRLLIDNVSVTAVPEPGTLSLLGLGATGMMAARRRRARAAVG